MLQGHFAEHWSDVHGNPAGGVSTGKGFTISWQNGPLGAIGTKERRGVNGAFVEDIIQAVIGRIEFYQAGPFPCAENAEALAALTHAAEVLDQRTQRRMQQGTEGIHNEVKV